jgi:alkylation response protein AidB-like acyl-CoA dehydrogenase
MDISRKWASVLDFELTDEQNLIRKSVRDLCREEIAPPVRGIDEEGRIPGDLIRSMAELGLLGLTASEEYGG